MMYNIRQATIDDAVEIDRIWRERLEQDQPPNEESINRFIKILKEQDEVFKCWVLEIEGSIGAWASITPMRNSPALRSTMGEISVFLSKDQRGGMHAFKLFAHCIEYAKLTEIEWLWAFSGKSNRAVRGLSRRFPAWKKIGELPPIDKKPDRDIIEIWVLPMGQVLESSVDYPPPRKFTNTRKQDGIAYEIRQSTIDDILSIDRIWRERISENQFSGEESLKRFKKSLEEQNDVFRHYVLKIDGEVIGWSSLCPMRSIPLAHETMGEVSAYISDGKRGGFHTFGLMRRLIRHAKTTPIEWIFGFAGKNNRPTHGILKRFFWKQIGELPPVDKNPSRDIIEIWILPVGKIVEQEI